MKHLPALWWPLFLLVSLLSGASAAAGSISVTGTGGALGVASLLAEACGKADPPVDVAVLPGIGTTGGVKAVLAGKLDIGLAGRPLEEAERRAGAVAVPLARSPFVFCGHPGVAANALSLRDVIDIYDGRKTAWPDGTPIRLILRPEGESDLDILRGISKELADAVERAMRRTGMIVALHDRDAADVLENIPGAFGTLALGMVAAEKRKIKVFPLDGVPPSAKALTEGVYPLEKRFYLVTAAEPPEAVRRFLDFIRSGRAASILAQAEFIPLR